MHRRRRAGRLRGLGLVHGVELGLLLLKHGVGLLDFEADLLALLRCEGPWVHRGGRNLLRDLRNRHGLLGDLRGDFGRDATSAWSSCRSSLAGAT